MSKIELDYTAADAITVLVLKDQRSMIEQEIKAHLEKGEYMHSDDLAFNRGTLLPALEVIIKYFGS